MGACAGKKTSPDDESSSRSLSAEMGNWFDSLEESSWLSSGGKLKLSSRKVAECFNFYTRGETTMSSRHLDVLYSHFTTTVKSRVLREVARRWGPRGSIEYLRAELKHAIVAGGDSPAAMQLQKARVSGLLQALNGNQEIPLLFTEQSGTTHQTAFLANVGVVQRIQFIDRFCTALQYYNWEREVSEVIARLESIQAKSNILVRDGGRTPKEVRLPVEVVQILRAALERDEEKARQGEIEDGEYADTLRGILAAPNLALSAYPSADMLERHERAILERDNAVAAE